MIDEITVKNIISAELLSTVNWTQLNTKIAIAIGIAILAKIIARSIGFISRKFDELIDHVFKLDFSESFHKTIERVSGRFIWMFAAYLEHPPRRNTENKGTEKTGKPTRTNTKPFYINIYTTNKDTNIHPPHSHLIL